MWLLPILLFSIFMRRRPLARAAVVGGTAYYAGKKVQQGREQDAETEARLQDLEAQQQYAAQAAPEAPAKDPMEQLKELAALHEQGVLTDAEFEIQKTKILQSM
jgi:ribosomal 50S subunit-recycling heat shock protein